MSSEIVSVPFDGDTLEGVLHDEHLWVVVKRVCAALGVDPDGQRRKLRAAPWAVTEMLPATGSDGKTYECFALDMKSLPMWLANIHASKVHPNLRSKLIHYQRECAIVLWGHFFGKRTDAPVAALNAETEASPKQAAQGVDRLADLLTREVFTIRQEMRAGFESVLRRLDAREQEASQPIGPSEQRALRDARDRLVSLRVIGELSPNFRSARRWTWNLIQSAGNWFGRATQLALLPMDRFPQVMVALRSAMAEAEAAAAREGYLAPLGSGDDVDAVIPY